MLLRLYKNFSPGCPNSSSQLEEEASSKGETEACTEATLAQGCPWNERSSHSSGAGWF